MHEPHLDFYESQGETASLYMLDPRVKLICAAAAILAVLFTVHWQTSALFFSSCFFLVLYYKLPVTHFIKRLIYPLYIIIIVAVIQPFTYGSTVAFQLPFLALPVYEEGLGFALLIFIRCLAAVSILTLLVMTTPLMNIMEALAWFHVPAVLLDLALLMFRYVFVISEEAERLYRAQSSRCGYSRKISFSRKLGNYGTLFGTLLIRSYERAVKVGNAMISRGYKGENLFAFKDKAVPNKHILYGVILLLGIVLLILADQLL